MSKPQEQQQQQSDDRKGRPQDPKNDEKLSDKDLDKVSGGMMPAKPKETSPT